MSIKFWLDTLSLVFMGAFIIWVMWDSTNTVRVHCPRCKKFDWKYDRMLKAHICKRCGFKLKDLEPGQFQEFLDEFDSHIKDED